MTMTSSLKNANFAWRKKQTNKQKQMGYTLNNGKSFAKISKLRKGDGAYFINLVSSLTTEKRDK